MPSSAGLEFDTIFNWDGEGTASSDYIGGNLALEMQSPLGTALTFFNTVSHHLYLGDAEKFDMAVFDLSTSGSLGALTWQFYNGSAWATFTPSSGRLRFDVDDTGAGGVYDFGIDGVEMFPSNQLSTWATTAINSATKYLLD